MYIWRKRVTPGWLRLRSEDLDARFGAALATVERPGKRHILIEVSCRTLNQGRTLVREFGGRVEKIPRNWLRDFAKGSQTKPLHIGSRLIISATPVKKQQNRSARTIIIPGEAAFGTGEHATTAMCLRLLERHTRERPPGWSMLDAGTGSGILALAARCLGAARVLAIDIDPLACATAKRNARANGVRNIEFRTSDVLELKLRKKFDLITANLFSEILIAAVPGWARHLAAGGRLIVSGILRNQQPTVVGALRRHDFYVSETGWRGKWIALLAHRGAKERI
jgi:ribosomal protein L11 methyltransferase